jgi:hypothetical protein
MFLVGDPEKLAVFLDPWMGDGMYIIEGICSFLVSRRWKRLD